MTQPGGLRTQIAALVQHEPRSGSGYFEVLIVENGQPRARAVMLGLGGAILGLATYVIFAPWVITGVLSVFWAAQGSPGELLPWAQVVSSTFSEPSGMVATQLGLAILIPISMGLVLFVHRFHPRWLHSVQPGFRWRLGLISGGAALVIIGGMWAISRFGESWALNPEPALAGYLIAILLTSPLQAAAEEYFFRGYLVQAIGSMARVGPWLGVVGSAVIFALMHGTQNLPAFLYRLLFGLIAGWLVVKTGGLEAAIAAHVANNVIAFGWAALAGSMVATKTTSETTWAGLAWTLAGFAVYSAAAVLIARRLKAATTTP